MINPNFVGNTVAEDLFKIEIYNLDKIVGLINFPSIEFLNPYP